MTNSKHSLSVEGLPAAEMPWRCFHCDEVFTDRESAADHFGAGDFEMEIPLCVEAATKSQEQLILTMREAWKELLEQRDTAEAAEFRAGCWESAAREFLNSSNADWHDLANYRDTAEGRILAAEAAINAAPRWLATFLRQRAERLWKRNRSRSPLEDNSNGS